MILIVTAQPEQQRNVERAAKLGLHHRVVPWNEGSTKEQFVKDFTEAYRSLIQEKRACPATREFEAPSHNALRRLPKMAGGLVSRHETRWLAAHQSERCGFLGPLSKAPIQV